MIKSHEAIACSPSEILQFFFLTPLLFKKIPNFMPILKSYVIRDRTLLASNKKPHTKEEFTVLTWKCKCGVDFRTTGSRNLGEALGFCLSVCLYLSLALSSSFCFSSSPLLFPPSPPLSFTFSLCGLNSGSLLVIGR